VAAAFQAKLAPMDTMIPPRIMTLVRLMCPEAYTLDAVLRSWAAGDSPPTVHQRAAAAYAAYQKITQKAAAGVFVAGPDPQAHVH